MSKSTPVFDWFIRRFGRPTLAQSVAWPIVRSRKNVLIASPTGTGKTLAAFLGIIDQLDFLQRHGQLLDTIYCVYVSPLRALAYDLRKNLTEPLREIYGDPSPIRVEMRTGDTPSTHRQKQFSKPPHFLLTTPESLCLLLSQKKWLPVLANVRWCIVDEIHALAENKRGAHLSLSMERLGLDSSGRDKSSLLQRIGLSATVGPLEAVGRFLVGTHGECEIVDVSSAKKISLRVHTPLRKNPYPEAGYTGQRLIRELAGLVRKHQTTLVFTNTRSGAEAASFWLREQAPELAAQIECHHASLDRDVRLDVEDRLKRGELRAVVCSTSLELGIDIGAIDLVVMLSTPKGVSKALQRTGRSGHNIHTTSRGVIMATNVNDLVESCATALLGRAGYLDDVCLPEAPLDVLAQHLVSMGCGGPWNRKEALNVIRGAHPFARLPKRDFDDVLEYLAGGGKSLREQYSEVFGKIELNEEQFRTRAGQVQRDFLQNVGVIPEVGLIRVRLKSKALGSVEENFLRMLQPGDVFIISGKPVRLLRVDQMEAYVERADGAMPTVPRWNANKMPLTNNVAEEVTRFRLELRGRLEKDATAEYSSWIAKRLDCGASNAAIIEKMFKAQHAVSEIPTGKFLLVESFRETFPDPKNANIAKHRLHYFFHSLIGRSANDALARVVTRRLYRLRGGNAVAISHDYGFVLTVSDTQQIEEGELTELMASEGFDEDLEEVLSNSDMLKYHFRNAAQTGLMVYRNYFGQRKPVRKLQWSAEVIFRVLQQHEPDHVLLREARRDAMHVFVDAKGALAYLQRAAHGQMRLRKVAHIPPLSFAMFATKIREALLVEDPTETMERLFNIWWNDLCEDL